MSRPLASINAEIAIAEAQIASLYEAASYSVGGRSKTNVALETATKRLDFLYQQKARVDGSAPMFARVYVDGLR